MRQRKLGQRLRAILLATPLIGAPACSSSGPPNCSVPHSQAQGTEVFGLTGDAGDCQGQCDATKGVGPFGSGLISLDSCSFVTLSDGGSGVSCTGLYQCGPFTGRRPAALRTASAPASCHPLGAFFAEAARLEAASVPAFAVLADELARFSAPAGLIDAARRARADEVRHARITGTLSRRYGGTPLRPELGAQPEERALEAIATENAVEGCVRETYGALLASWQARRAADPVIATTMAPIAEDETGHAELAWEVAAWADTKLTRAARHRVAEARMQALDDLLAEVSGPIDPTVVALAGVPSPQDAAVLARALASQLA